MSNDFVKGLLKARLTTLSSEEAKSNDAKLFFNLVCGESRAVAEEIRVYTKDIPELNFNMGMLTSVIEEFYLAKFSAELKVKYDDRNKPKDDKFKSQLEAIETYTVGELMDLLDIKNEFRLSNSKQPAAVPYKAAILELNKIGNMTDPKEILVRSKGKHNQNGCKDKDSSD